MVPGFLLLHSPSLGPASMEPLAEAVSAHGRVTAVPSSAGVARGAPPYWPRLVEAACGGAPDGPLIVVAHSNAGLFVPLIVAELGGRAAGCAFVDASIPPPSGDVPAAEEEFLPFLRDLADERGVLPRWTDWWPPEDTAALFPDPLLRHAPAPPRRTRSGGRMADRRVPRPVRPIRSHAARAADRWIAAPGG
ncbi:hypothetical protein [Thermostaphylospora chromogena]|uniref:Alpha/beta hydrolase family protein n=1 Tax=Thermostaphylospora chromogena TaxID=35622 RepID=A0A1H1FTR9_9ACTN|nr:hypothetical protein [Thermostaphylospora chromogena]SDR04387.1 hypothetical protein SAMN04489764_3182 [Thermostaphylospora chromogena]